MVCSGAKSKVKDPQFSTYYSALTNNVPDYPNPCFHQIELDLKRTFPEDAELQLPGMV